jgi:hypothetical protein
MGFLRSIFGPSKDEIWGQLAGDIGGEYQKGGFLRPDVLRYRSGEWEITLDTYTVSNGKTSSTYTRMRAPFVNKDGLYFQIYRAGFFSSIGKALGMQDLVVGNPYFDEAFIIKGNNADKIKSLLSDPKLTGLIRQQPDICFEIRDDEGWFGAKFPEGVDELRFQCYGVLRDEPLLRNLFEMFSTALQRLVQIDSAYENDPNVSL